MRSDPYPAFHFLVDIEGVGDGERFQASFLDVRGLRGDVDVYEIREGGGGDFVHRVPGRVRWGPVSFRKGVVDEGGFFQWWEEACGARPGRARRDLSISLLGRDLSCVRRWTLRRAWPQSWEGPTLDAMSPNLAIEQLVVVHDGITQE